MSSGKFTEDGLGFSFEVNNHRKQFSLKVGYIKETKKIYIRSGTYDYPASDPGTSITNEQTIVIDPERAMILFNDNFWQHIPEIMKNIEKEIEKND